MIHSHLEEIKNYKPIVRELHWKPSEESLDFYRNHMKKPDHIRNGVMTQNWPNFNTYFGGARSELIAITADTAQGKSTFARAWLREMLFKDHKSGLITLEDTMLRVTKHFAKMETGLEELKDGTEEAKWFGRVWQEYPLWYLDHRGPLQDEMCLKSILYASQVLGMKFFVVDHLDYIQKTHAYNTNESYLIGDFLRKLSGIAHEEEITIVIIVHPSKLSFKGVGSREVGRDEMKGSSSIKQECDSVLGVFRPDPTTNQTDIRFLKIREAAFSQYTNGKISFLLNKSGKYEEMPGGISYE